MLKIVHIPNKVLTTPTKPVTTFDSSLMKLVTDMEAALIACVDPQGVGLAATQVGKSISLFLMKPSSESETQTIINPHILETDAVWPEKAKEKAEEESDGTPLEGCLSIPQIWAPVERAYRTKLSYQDVNGKQHEKWFEDFESIIVQHEVDHLNGVLFTQRALEQDAQLYEEKDGELKKMKTDI